MADNINVGQQVGEDSLTQIALPITAEMLIEQLKPSELFIGQYNFFIFGNTITVPAATTTVYEVFPGDTINVLYKHHTIVSDFYDPTITFQFNIDDTRYNLTPDTIPLNEAKELTLSYYLPIKIKQQYIIANPFAFDIHVTIYFETVEMHRSFYENWYKNLLLYSEKKLSELVNI